MDRQKGSDIIAFFRDVISHRELLMHLVSKNLKVQYRRPWLGFLWAFIVPIVMVLVFKLVFSIFLRITVEPYPFFIYLMTAVLPWQYFGNSAARGATSILENKTLIKESPFPRELIPLSVVVANLVNFIPSIGIIFVFLLIYKVPLSLYAVLLPMVIIIHSFFILGFTFIASSLQVRFRDLRYCVELIVFMLFYLTPVFYPLAIVEEHFPGILFKVYLLNPLVGILNFYRVCFLGGFLDTVPGTITLFEFIGIPLIGTVFIFFLGLYIFRNEKRHFIDHISV